MCIMGLELVYFEFSILAIVPRRFPYVYIEKSTARELWEGLSSVLGFMKQVFFSFSSI